MLGGNSLGFSRVFVVVAVFLILLVVFLLVKFEKLTLKIDNSDPFKTYSNSKYGYSIKYPRDWVMREFDSKTGAAFRPVSKPDDPSFEYITINAEDRDRAMIGRPLEEYAKVAASKMQNYKSLNSLTRVATKTGLIGYKTTWKVALQGGGETVSGPITYFDAPKDLPATIQLKLTNYDYLDLYGEMLQTLRYSD